VRRPIHVPNSVNQPPTHSVTRGHGAEPLQFCHVDAFDSLQLPETDTIRIAAPCHRGVPKIIQQHRLRPHSTRQSLSRPTQAYATPLPSITSLPNHRRPLNPLLGARGFRTAKYNPNHPLRPRYTDTHTHTHTHMHTTYGCRPARSPPLGRPKGQAAPAAAPRARTPCRCCPAARA
jgi:hypothetical protein